MLLLILIKKYIKNPVRIKAPNSVNESNWKHKNQINYYDKQRRVLMANPTIRLRTCSVCSVFADRMRLLQPPEEKNEKHYHTGRMYRLIWVFASHTGLIVGFVVRRLNLYNALPVPNYYVQNGTGYRVSKTYPLTVVLIEI